MSKLEILHQETSVSPLTMFLYYRFFHQYKKNHKYLKPLYFKNTIVVFKSNKIDWYGDLDNFKTMADKIISDVKKDSNYSQRLLNDVTKIGQQIYKEGQKIIKSDLKKASNRQLAEKLNKIYQLGNNISDLGMVAVIPDLRHSKLTDLLKSIIRQKKKDYKLTKAVNNYLNPLITSTKRGLVHQEKLELLRLVKKIGNQKNLNQILKSQDSVIYKKIEKVSQNYNWLSFGQLGPAKKFEQFTLDIKAYLKGRKFNQEYKSLIEENKKLKERQSKYVKELRLNAIEKRLFKATQDFSYNKVYRFDVLLFCYYALDKLLQEISKRINLTVKELRFASREEITQLLQGIRQRRTSLGLEKPVTKNEIKKRQKYCLTIIKGKGVVFLTGQKAKNYLVNKVEDSIIQKDITIIHGMTVFLGKVTGKVKIVNSPKDIKKVKQGDVIVSVQTNPDLLPAMKKAAAFVTDIGGITSHAAIVARELKKPCIVGLRTVTKVFKDGDKIEVDAIKGDVRKL